jgi:segregation and condensation protein B
MSKLSSIYIEAPFTKLSYQDQKSVVEAIIFASDDALSLESLRKMFIGEIIDNGDKIPGIDNGNGENPDEQETEQSDYSQFDDLYFSNLIHEINTDLIKTGRPYHIVHAAGGYLFATRPEYGKLIYETSKLKTKRRLSHAALEVLAIVAYKQPITKPEVELIRGVNSSEVINALAEKNIVEEVGKKDTLGKPIMYGTTDEFLKIFGLNSLKDLPRLKEFEEMNNEEDYPETTLEINISPEEMMKKTKIDISTLETFKPEDVDRVFEEYNDLPVIEDAKSDDGQVQ